MFASHGKSVPLSPFPVTNLRREVELMYLLRMRRHYRHKVAKNGVASGQGNPANTVLIKQYVINVTKQQIFAVLDAHYIACNSVFKTLFFTFVSTKSQCLKIFIIL